MQLTPDPRQFVFSFPFPQWRVHRGAGQGRRETGRDYGRHEGGKRKAGGNHREKENHKQGAQEKMEVSDGGNFFSVSFINFFSSW